MPIQDDPLPAWNEGDTKSSIKQFVRSVCTVGSPQFVAPSQRIVVFDNDGTLWAEQPYYFQLAFALDRVRAIAPMHPEWETLQPFKAALEGDLQTLFAGGEPMLLKLLLATHTGNTTEEFGEIVKEWLRVARHPQTKRLYTAMIYQPMRELLDYLSGREFKIYIVSGGGIEFMRAFSEEIYNIPPERVIGSSIKTQFEWRDGVPVLARLPEVDFVNDNAGKPVGIHQFIGRRPIAAFGNSDGDLEMFQWTMAGNKTPYVCLLHHTDAEREWAYDRASPVGRLDRALTEARTNRWTVVDMKQDWNCVFPP